MKFITPPKITRLSTFKSRIYRLIESILNFRWQIIIFLLIFPLLILLSFFSLLEVTQNNLFFMTIFLLNYYVAVFILIIIFSKVKSAAKARSPFYFIKKFHHTLNKEYPDKSFIGAEIGVYKGKNAKVLFPLIDEFLETSIKQAGNFIDPTKRTYKIKLDLPQNELNIKPNLNAKVSVNDYSNNNAILIKEGFISIDSNNEKYVYKISREEKIAYASKTIVQTGKNNGNYIEVTSGLSVDDEIVVEGMRKLVDNARVKIIK